MKPLFLFFACCGLVLVGSAQRVQNSDLILLQQKEDSMKVYAEKLIQGITAADRFNADSIFTKMFVRALKTSHSFFLPL